MDFFTTTALSGIIYDIYKFSAKLTADQLRSKLQGWLIDDALVKELESKITHLNLQDYSERKITSELERNSDIQRILQDIKSKKQANNTEVNQIHSGVGDNVANIKIKNNA